MNVEADAGRVRLFEGPDMVAGAIPSSLAIEVPEAPSFDEAVDASKSFVAMERHPFPRCFVCGTQREVGDGMRIFSGEVAGRSILAAPWVPDVAFAEGSDRIKP